jgi:hypothetical protein
MSPDTNPSSLHTASDPADPATDRRSAGEALEATSRAVLDAHDALTLEAIEGVRFERRGLLQRLTRV